MTAVVLLALAIPIVGAVSLAVTPSLARRVVPVTGGLGGAAWMAVAAAEVPVAVGRLEIDALLACALAGALLLVAAVPPATATASAVVLALLTLVAVGASDPGEPSVLLALAIAGLAVPIVLTARSLVAPPPLWRLTPLLVGVALAAAGAGWRSDAATASVALALSAAVVVTLATERDGVHLVPVVLIAVFARSPADDPAAAAVAGALAGAVVAVVLSVRLIRARRADRTLDVTAAAAVGAALVLSTLDLTGARGAGLLVAAGAVLVAAARHRVADVALLPGVAAAISVLARGDEPRHAAAGVAVVLLALVAASSDRSDTATWVLGPAVVFGLAPVWGWAGVDLPAVREGVAVAATATLVAATGWSIVVLRSVAESGMTDDHPSDAGSIPARRALRPAPSHGDQDPQEAAVEER